MKICLYKCVKLLKKVKPSVIAIIGGKKIEPEDIANKMTFQITFFTLRITLLSGLSFGNWVEIATAFDAPKHNVKLDVASVKFCQNFVCLPLKMKKRKTTSCIVICKKDSTASSVKLINPLNLFQASP